jgi:hypothetical protein
VISFVISNNHHHVLSVLWFSYVNIQSKWHRVSMPCSGTKGRSMECGFHPVGGAIFSEVNSSRQNYTLDSGHENLGRFRIINICFS